MVNPKRAVVAACLAVALCAAAGVATAAAPAQIGGGPNNPRPPIAPFVTSPLPDRRVVVPMVFPVLGATRWRNGYNADRGSHRHTGIDILAPKMRPVVAPFPGVLGFKTQTFWVYGDNGYKCLGTHLNDDTPGTNDNRGTRDFMFAPNLRPGDRVAAGQLIGYVGDSGLASGPHLHFELFAPDGLLVNPFPSLKAAGRVTAPNPVLSDGATRPPVGQVRVEGCVRGWDPTRRVLTLIGVTRETATGRADVLAQPKWIRFLLTSALVAAAGGDRALYNLPRDRPITLYVEVPRGPRPGAVRRLVLPAGTPE